MRWLPFFFGQNSYSRRIESHRDVQGIVTGAPFQLIESVAERIAQKILADYPKADRVRVEIAKPHVAVPGVLEGLGVSIVRGRDTKWSCR